MHTLAASALASAAAGCPAPAACALASAGDGCSLQAAGPCGRLQPALQRAQRAHGRQRRWHSLVGAPPPAWPRGFAALRAGGQLFSERARQRRLLAAAAAEPCLAALAEQGTVESLAMQGQDLPAAPPRPAGLLPETAPALQRDVPTGAQLRLPAMQQNVLAEEAALGTLPAAPLHEAAAASGQPPPQRHAGIALPSGAAGGSAAGSLALQPGEQPFQLPVPNLGYTCLNIQLQQRHGIRTNR